jgi:hypothetical protein
VGSTVARGIEDTAAADAGLTNLVMAADLATLLGALERGTELDCELVVEATPRLRLRRANGVLPDLPPDVAALAGQLRVRLDGGPDGWNVEFPAAG